MNETARNWLLFIVAIILAAIYLFPLYWMYITSLKTGSEMFATPLADLRRCLGRQRCGQVYA